jgi:hypothetical protein
MIWLHPLKHVTARIIRNQWGLILVDRIFKTLLKMWNPTYVIAYRSNGEHNRRNTAYTEWETVIVSAHVFGKEQRSGRINLCEYRAWTQLNATNELHYLARNKKDDIEILYFLSTRILGVALRIYCGSEPKRLPSVGCEVNFCVRCTVLRHFRVGSSQKLAINVASWCGNNLWKLALEVITTLAGK